MRSPADGPWSSDPVDRPGGRPWDLLVVGGGTAGLVAAHTAAELGAAVLLVEADRTGGDCLWTGCVPSKALLAAAHAAARARTAGGLGVRAAEVDVDFDAVMRHVRSAIGTIEPVDSPDALREVGVAVARGHLGFTGPRSAEVEGRPIRFLASVLATGSTPWVPEVPGLQTVAPLTTDSVWELTELPGRLLVLGGGPVGCELGQAFARLGSDVTLVEPQRRLLPAEHPDAGHRVAEALRADGVEVRTGARVASVVAERGGARVELADGDVLYVDRVLAAAGRRPRTDGLGLELAGVRLRATGHLVVDEHLRTTHPRIWAAGDVTGHPAFTHTASVHGGVAAANALLGVRRRVAPHLVPRVVYTDPEVASFGPAGDAGAAEGGGRRSTTAWRYGHGELDRAVTSGATDGFSEVLLDRRGRVVGATVVGPRAADVLPELLLAASEGTPARRLAGLMHPYPTWSEGPWRAVVEQARGELGRPVVRRGVAAALAVRRRWLAR